MLKRKRLNISIAPHECQSSRKTAARAFTCKTQVRDIDSELRGMLDDPAKSRKAILYRAGKAFFRRQSIVDGNQHAAKRSNNIPMGRLELGGRSRDKAAAMNVIDRRQRSDRADRPVNI
ncbi:MAG: hypothetical protein QOI59_6412 [Gammaproteobacteria bacterium]|nr:hypothetical protein [Gammaproteobacteria bacterium]